MKSASLHNAFLAIATILLVMGCKKTAVPDMSPLFLGVKNISIGDLKTLSAQTEVTLPSGNEGKQITGVVISDIEGKNDDPKTVVLQSEDHNPVGIVIEFDSVAPFKTGDKLVVDLSGKKLVKKEGEIRLIGIPMASVTLQGKSVINLRYTSINELLDSVTAWSGTLVSLYDGTLTGGNGKYNGSLNYTETDSIKSINVPVAAGAAFENKPYPDKVRGLTGILRTKGANTFIEIRNANDVENAAVTHTITDDMTVLGFRDPSKWSDKQIFEQTDFETKQFSYTGGNMQGFINPFPADQDFLSNSQLYFYSFTGPFATWLITYNNTFIISAQQSLKGVKEISVTFAGSKQTGLFATDTYGDSCFIRPFDPAADVFQIGLGYSSDYGYPLGGGGVPSQQSQKVGSAGIFTTVKFIVPDRRELLKYAPSDPSQKPGYIAEIDRWLAAPGFNISNLSTRAAVHVDPSALFSNEVFTPIIITKIEYGL